MVCLYMRVPQAYIEEFLRQHEENKAAALASARAEDQKIRQYQQMVRRSCILQPVLWALTLGARHAQQGPSPATCRSSEGCTYVS